MSFAAGKPMHCLSFDVEEHFQVSAFWSEARRQQWDKYESRVENNTSGAGSAQFQITCGSSGPVVCDSIRPTTVTVVTTNASPRSMNRRDANIDASWSLLVARSSASVPCKRQRARRGEPVT